MRPSRFTAEDRYRPSMLDSLVFDCDIQARKKDIQMLSANPFGFRMMN